MHLRPPEGGLACKLSSCKLLVYELPPATAAHSLQDQAAMIDSIGPCTVENFGISEGVIQTPLYTGTFEGDDVTHYGGLATFQSTYGTAKGSHSVTGESIRCESDSTGVFVVSATPFKASAWTTPLLLRSPGRGDGRSCCKYMLWTCCAYASMQYLSCESIVCQGKQVISQFESALAGKWHGRWLRQLCRDREHGQLRWLLSGHWYICGCR